MSRVCLSARVEALGSMARPQLVVEWERAYGRGPPSHLSVQLLQWGIASRLQEDGRPRSTRRVKYALSQALTTSSLAPSRKPRSGSRLLREWNGVAHVVEVVDGGFRYRGRRYPSLTRIAFEITGARWSGPRFFGLKARSG